MSTINKILIFVLTVMLGSTFYLKNISSEPIHLKLDYASNSINELSRDSQIIVRAEVGSSIDKLSFEGVDFTRTSIVVKEFLKGSINEQEISVLQTISVEDPQLIANTDVILFLEKYEGPITDDSNTFVCKGLYQGQYVVSNGYVNNVGVNEEYSTLGATKSTFSMTLEEFTNEIYSSVK